MTRYHGTEKVEAGIYLNLREVALRSMDGTGTLPGHAAAEYYRVPEFVLLIAAPIFGAMFVMFLPMIGFALVGWYGARKAVESVGEMSGALVRVMQPAWEPARAFLSRAKKGTSEAKHGDAWSERMKDKIEHPESK